jgi:hypothetical protein
MSNTIENKCAFATNDMVEKKMGFFYRTDSFFVFTTFLMTKGKDEQVIIASVVYVMKIYVGF